MANKMIHSPRKVYGIFYTHFAPLLIFLKIISPKNKFAQKRFTSIPRKIQSKLPLPSPIEITSIKILINLTFLPFKDLNIAKLRNIPMIQVQISILWLDLPWQNV